MTESNGFSGLTKAQAEIIAYWRSKCRNGGLPHRGDIDPGVLRSHLAAISIVEIEPDGGVRFRIAGSEVRAVFGQEMRGRRLDEFQTPAADMWALGLTAVLERHRPVGGIIERGNDSHTWLRLPLQPTAQGCLILCHDMIVARPSILKDKTDQSHSRSDPIQPLAA